ncbi:MAG: AraC family transcriptional regulator [Steroidobacteraceae bacterium]|nr:AraC family transcriptional regulator [Steroidobacteraceae bacterium]
MPNPAILAAEPRGSLRGVEGSGEPGTVAICFVVAALQSVRARSFDADELLSRVGLSADLLQLPQARVSAKQYGELWRLVALTLDDEFFGQDSRRMKSGSFAMLCHSVIHCRNLAQALERSLRFYRLILDDIRGELVREDREARIELHTHAGAVQPRVFAHEILLMLLYGLACWLVNRRLPIQHAQFGYPEPAHSGEYRLMYCDALRFDAPCTAIAIEAAHLDLPLAQNERTLKDFLRTAPENIILKYKNTGSVGARIRRRIRQAPPGEAPDFEVLAREFHMTAATLRRRLREEGVSFQSIKDDLRRDLAVRYLTHSGRSVMDIALELGFSERSSFHRAFRKWTGASPGQFRSRDAAAGAVRPASCGKNAQSG